MIIKNIWDKVYFHPLFYIIVIISLLTAHFRNLFIFTSIILIHELGHTIAGIILGMNLKRIEIYPFGGCSKLRYDINIKIVKELIVVIMGPLVQIVYTYLIYYFKIDVPKYFYSYSIFILTFNMFPIYPLDGGRIVNLLLSIKLSFYSSLKLSFYTSYFFMSVILFLTLLVNKNLFFIIIVISLILEVIKELNRIDYYFNKFLLERYINNYNFKKSMYVETIYKMQKEYIHFFIINNKIIPEKLYLEKVKFNLLENSLKKG